MGRHVCSMCPFFCHSEVEFLSHLFKNNKHSAKFVVHCNVCGASYRNVIEHCKYFLCVRMCVVDFCSHTGSFAVQPSDHTVVIRYSDLVYKWPQHVKKLSQNLSLVMQNVDDIWTM